MLLLLVLLAGDVEARLRATVEASAADVSLSYRIEASESSERVAFTILQARGATVENLEVTSSGAVVPLRFSSRGGAVLRGDVRLPGDAVDVTFRYRAVSTERGVVTIPVVVLQIMPASARSGTFTAELTPPGEATLVESFPAHAVRESSSRYSMELPIVPAFVSLHFSTSATVLTFPRLLDGAVTGLLFGIVVALIRRVRSTA